MSSLVEFWKEEYRIDRTLESDSRTRRLLNTFVVAPFMNTFPRAAIKLFSKSRGELARLLFVEREGGSYRVLRTMYRFEDAHQQGDFLNRLLMQSPAVKAARNRRKIAQRMLQESLKSLPEGSPKLVVAVGGGDGSQEAEAISGLDDPNVYYCGVDQDNKSAAENEETLRKHGLEKRGFTFVGTVNGPSDIKNVLQCASERFSVEFNEISVAVCQGLIEYLDMNSDANDELSQMLRAMYECTRTGGSLLISQTDFHDRVKFLENGLEWYMRLRDIGEVAAEVEKAGWRISTCEKEPMNLITMCLASKSDGMHSTTEVESPIRRPHIAEKVAQRRRKTSEG